MRRVSLDVIGILPTIDETNAFLADSSADKRSKLIDQLLERDEYPKFWALKWGDLLKMTSKLVGNDGVFKYHRWVEAAIRSNMPYDEFARELLSAGNGPFCDITETRALHDQIAMMPTGRIAWAALQRRFVS